MRNPTHRGVNECNGDFATVTPSLSCSRATGLAVLAFFPPKVQGGQTPQHQIRFGNNKLRVEAEGHLSATVESSEHSSPLSGFLKLSQPI